MKNLLYVFTLLAIACSPNNPKMQAPIKATEVVNVDPGTLDAPAESKVDVLFVMDDSQSMKTHQENISNNIKHFLNEFKKMSLVDIHVGVTSAYDRRAADEMARRQIQLPADQRRVSEINPVGHLLPLVNPETGAKMEGPRYITKNTPNYLAVLEKTLLVGAKPGPDQQAASFGTWFEEFFSPITAVFRSDNVNGVNVGFYRPDAYLVIFIITDGDDGSPNDTSTELQNHLIALKGGQKNMVQPYAAIIPSGRSCSRDRSGEPLKIMTFLSGFENRRDRILDLCSSNFGRDLAKFGQAVAQTIPRKRIQLPSGHAKGSVRVFYGPHELEISKHYNLEIAESPAAPSYVVLQKDLKDIDYNPEFKISVKYDQYDPLRYVNRLNQ